MVTIFKRFAIVVVLVCTLGLSNWPSFAQTSDGTTGAFNIFVPIVANNMAANNMTANNVVANDSGARELTVLAAGVVTELQPTGYVTEQGSDGGQPVTNLHVMDQSGSQNNWNKYLELVTTSQNYRGHRFYGLPANIDPASITSLQVKANYLGPEKSYQAWTWRIYDWANGTWVTIGNNTGAPSWQWKLFTFNVPGNPANYVNSSTREIKVRLQSNNTNDNMDLDYEAVVVETGSAPTPTNTPVPPTATYTPVPPTATNTPIPQPTATNTPVPTATEPAPGGVELQPTGYQTEQGSDGGQPVTNLHVMDQSGSQNNWDKYVELETTSQNYRGQRFYTLPANIDPASITSLQVKANYLGPEKSYQAWTWRIYDWANGAWVTIGNNTGAPSWQWKLFTFTVPGNPANYVNSSTHEIKVRLQSNNTNDNMDLDYEAVLVETGSAPTPTNTPFPPTPTNTAVPPTATNTPIPQPTTQPPTPTDTPVATNVFYVAPNGNDSNPGTVGAPWRTIQHAANNAPAGSTVFVRDGTYAEKVVVNVSGSAGNYITFRNYEGEVVTLDGSTLNVSGDEGLFKIVDRSYIIIQGFELKNLETGNQSNVPAAIWIQGSAHHIQILGNKIHGVKTQARANGNAHGIAVYGTSLAQSISDIVIEGNEIYDLQLGNSEALVLNGNVDGFTVANNLVYDIDNIGIDVIGWEDGIVGQNGINQFDARNQARNGVIRGNIVHDVNSYDNPAYFVPGIGNQYSAGGIYVDGGRDVVIEQNVVYDTDYGIELASEHVGRFTSSVTVRNNFVYHSHAVGIGLGGSEEDNGGAENCVITNNTLFQNGTESVGAISELYIQNHVHNNIIMNNIISADGQHYLIYSEYSTMSGNTLNHNLYYAPGANNSSTWVWQGSEYNNIGAYQNATGNDGNSLFGNPQFVSTSSPNLHLTSSSPAVNAGVTGVNYGPEDIDGEGRVQGASVDIGADEFGGATNAGVEHGVGQFQIFLPTIMGN